MPTYVITGARGGIALEYVNQLSKDPATTTLVLVRDTTTATLDTVSKAALNMLTVHQAKQLRSSGLIAVAVDPGRGNTASGGGVGAAVEVEDSAGSILRLLRGLAMCDSDKLFLYDRNEVPRRKTQLEFIHLAVTLGFLVLSSKDST